MASRKLLSLLAPAALAAICLYAAGCSKSSSTGPGGGVGGTITVTGKVIGANGVAVAGVPVVVTGVPSTNTDANGNFSIANVTTPYSITVVNAAVKSGFVYKGLTRSDPTLVFLNTVPGTANTGSVSGKISGGDFTPNQGVNDVTRVEFASPQAISSSATGADGTFGPLSLNWYGPSVTTGSLYALQIQNDPNPPNLPVTYKGYGVKSGIAVNNGSTVTSQFDTLQNVSTVQFTGTITLAAGYSFTNKAVWLKASSMALLPLFADPTTATSLSYNTPNVSGATLTLQVLTQNAAGAIAYAFKVGLSPGATGVAINVPAAPGQSLPINGATGVDTTFAFSWTSYTGGIYVWFAQSGGNPTYYVLTAGTSTTIPNLKSLGLPLPSSAAYTWRVAAFAPFASADAAAGPGGFLSTFTAASLVALTGDVNVAESGPWSFTSAP